MEKYSELTGIFLVSIAVAGCVGFWYTHTHERQILEWQIQKDRTNITGYPERKQMDLQLETFILRN